MLKREKPETAQRKDFDLVPNTRPAGQMQPVGDVHPAHQKGLNKLKQ